MPIAKKTTTASKKSGKSENRSSGKTAGKAHPKMKPKTQTKVSAKAAPKTSAKMPVKTAVTSKAKPKVKPVAKSTQKTKQKMTANTKSTQSASTKLKVANPKTANDSHRTSKAPAKTLKPVKTSDSFARSFHPLDNRVLVRREGLATTTPGGIIIPDTVAASDRSSRGLVLAVGTGHRDKKGRIRPLDVKQGDAVLFSSHAGAEIKSEGEDLVVLREDEIIAVVKT